MFEGVIVVEKTFSISTDGTEMTLNKSESCYLLELLTNFLGKLGAFGSTSQIGCQMLSLFDNVKTGTLDSIGKINQLHMPEHHAGTEK